MDLTLHGVGPTGLSMRSFPPGAASIGAVERNSWAELHGIDAQCTIVALNGQDCAGMLKDEFQRHMGSRPLTLKVEGLKVEEGIRALSEPSSRHAGADALSPFECSVPEGKINITYVSDVEGHWDYFCRFVEVSKALRFVTETGHIGSAAEVAQMREPLELESAKGWHLVHGGDSCDEGPGTIRFLACVTMLKARYVLAALALTLVILITLEASGRTQMATLRLATASFGLASWIRSGHAGGADGTGPEEQSADGRIAWEKPSVPSFGMASWIRSGDEAGAGGTDGAGPQEQSTDGRVLQEESSVPASSCPQESSCSKEFGGHCPHSLSLFCDVKRSLEVELDFTPHQEARDWLMHRTCAFVSSSGANRLFRNGNEIDSHDVVFRVNKAPVKQQFRDYVGMKNSVRVLEQFSDKWDHREWLHTHVRQNNATDPWLYIPALGGRRANEHIVTPLLPDAVKKNVAFAWPLTKGTTENQTENQTFDKLEELLRKVFPDNVGKGKNGKTYDPTTGAVAIIFALSACRSVDAYGMHAVPHSGKAPYNYWSHWGSANSNGWHGMLRSEHELWARLSVDPAAGRRTGKLRLPGFDCIDCSGVLPQAPIHTSVFSGR